MKAGRSGEAALTETYEILILKYGEMSDRFRRDNYVMDDSHDVADPID